MNDYSRLEGVWSPILMPVDETLAIDVQRFTAHAHRLLAHGCHGLALFGTTGEANSFSAAERMALLEAALDSGIAPERLMVGTGCCAVTDSVALTRHSAALGCKRVLVLPPFYYKNMSDEGLFRSYAAVIERVADPALQLILYHFPQLSGVPITAALLERLIGAFPDTIAGVKDSSGDWSNTRMLLERFPGLAIFPGSEVFLTQGLKAGAAGCITATANVNAPRIRAVHDAWVTGDGTADRHQLASTALREAIERWPLVPAQKHLLAYYGNDPAWRAVRPPMLSFPEHDEPALLRALERCGYDHNPAVE